MKQKKMGGLTFTEVMISLFFLNLTILLFLGIVSLMLRGSQKLVDYSSGTIVSTAIVDKFLYNTPFPPTGEISGEVYSEGLHFEYKLDIIEVAPQLRKVDVRVFWWDSSSEGREGYGQLYTGFSTLVRENGGVK